MPQVCSFNLSEKSARPTPMCEYMCTCAFAGMWVCVQRPEPSLSFLSYSMDTGLLPSPELDWWPASPSDIPVPSPQFWVTGVWLHPGEVGWVGGGGGC